MLRTHRKYILPSIAIALVAISVIGMLILKNQLELESTANNELYFSFFRLLFIATCLVVFSDWFFKRWKEYQRLKNDKALAELHNLKNQVSPHFFFNTLNNLYGLINQDPEKSREYVLKLSELMRYAIYSSENNQVSIDEEVAYLENFIALHEIRYHEMLEIRFEQDIHDDQFQIAPLLLIVLLENAFKHGAEKLTEGAYIELVLRVTSDHLHFSVENNFETSTTKQQQGVGLKNLMQRLSLLYPDNHSLELSIKEDIYRAQLQLFMP